MIGKITEKQSQAYELYKTLKSVRKVAAVMGISKTAASNHVNAAKMNGIECLANVAVPDSLAFTKTTVKLHKNPETGEWEATDEWRRMHPAQSSVEDFARALADGVEGLKPPRPKVKTKKNGKGRMAIVILPDLHIGERIWAAECGVNWDVSIAVAVIFKAFCAAVDRIGPAEVVVLKNLGDLTHADNNNNATPKSNHRLDVDGRHEFTMERCAQLLESMIDYCLDRFPKVVYRSVKGNHDIGTNYAVSLILAAYYRKVKQVDVVLDKRKHQPWTYGVTAFLDTHGDTGRPARIKDLFATLPEWAGAKCRRIHSGHLHVDRVIPFAGCRFEIFEPPIPKGTYATDEAFGSDGQKIVAIFYEHDRGELGRIIEPIIPEEAPCER